jgi:lipopolysaccharide transport system ATP-binding protein
MIRSDQSLNAYNDVAHAYKQGDTLISLKNIGVCYKERRSIFKKVTQVALKDVSFDIFAGESIGIIGKNGAGKSTLLTVIAGIIKPDTGIIINNGVNVSLLALQVGFINELSGKDNIMLSGLTLGFKKDEIKKKMEAIIDFSGIRESIDNPVRTYSAGMRARLGFSITHILHPDVLLIDETLGVGDKDFKSKSSLAMKEKIKSEQTVVIVSHQTEMIRELCDRVLWLEGGEVIASGKTVEVLWQYERV